MTTMQVRGVSLYVKVVGHGYPLLLMHGGPGLDHISLLPFRRLAGEFTLIFYDHRCNGRSNGVPVSTMTWENLTADADALREKLGFKQWAVLGHSFGGQVALEYALRYPNSLSHLILMDTGGDTWWPRENAPELLARRGFSAETVEIARRWCHGQIEPEQMVPYARKLAGAYDPYLSPSQVPHMLFMALRMKTRPEPFIFGFTELYKGWNVMDRLGEINVPTLVLAGRDDWLFPPEHQTMLAAGIPNARLEIIERAGHNPQDEQTGAVMEVMRNFLVTSTTPAASPGIPSVAHQALDAMVEGEMRRLRIPGATLAIVEGDQIVHQRGFGRAHPGGEPPTPDTPFFIGSLTKAVTALAVMQLVEAGRVELDTPVQRYLPWFRLADAAAAAQITVRQLLNQTSGLPLHTADLGPGAFDNRPGAAERQARALATVELAHPPGATFEYSNANYDLLGLVVEAASGESYAGYVQQYIFDPLGMTHTFTAPGPAEGQGLATGHRYWFGWPVPSPNLPVAHASLASGQLISTAADMARFLIAYLNGGRLGNAQILSSAGIEELQRGAASLGAAGLGPLERLLARDVPPGQYAMGWFVEQSGTSHLVWHGGTLPHFGAFMALVPEQKKGLVLLFNACHHWMNPVYAEFGGRAAALLAGERPVPMPAVRAIPWMLRGLPLVPALQLAGAAATLRRIRRWRREPEQRPQGAGAWGQHLLLPLLANLSLALTLRPLLGKRRRYLVYYMPDINWTAMVCGGVALAWSLMRTTLVLDALRKPSSPLSSVRQPGPRRRLRKD